MKMTTPDTLPFPALVGLDAARQALLLLAVDPDLGGVVLAAGVGTGKSTLMRSFARLVNTRLLSVDGADGAEDGAYPAYQRSLNHFVELPVGVTEDRLLGGLDLELTLASGQRVHRSGLLARADGGMLYADGVNLLEESIINHVLAAVDTGVVRVEREGLSITEPARFTLLATYDPEEGPPRRHLMDRIGLLVAPIARSPAEARSEVVRRNLKLDNLADWLEEEQVLQALIMAAREQLLTVHISDEQVEQLINSALALGVEGHRADIFATRAALASAALEGRDEVEEADLERAIRYVLLPRATRVPQFQPPEEPEQPPEPPEPQPQEPPPDQQEKSDEQDEPPEPPEELQAIEDLVLAAMDADVPPDVLETPFTVRRSGRSGSRGSTSGQRGRHVRSVPGLPGQGRLDVVATLRAAAPWQGLRSDAQNNKEQPPANRRRKHTRQSREHARRLQLRVDDLHIKRYRSKAGTLFCFLVDASGSMALHRMRQAKGAVNALLQQAYVHRDQVALMAFRGEQAELLLPPSQSVELAKRALDVLPTGGGTPLASALLGAYQVAEQAGSRGIHQTTLVIITDGRPNVPLKPDPSLPKQQRMEQAREEVQRLAGRLRMAGIGAVVIDTQRDYLSRGEAQQLAAWLGGRYVYLPQGRGEEIAQVVLAASEEE